ncbi:MAG: general secretion pathway protein GspB, partial [Deltaproteobacteria bacterium]|nr:general secretion pathway protein GspB [Deltaproteobacteria bacterium]
GKSQYKLSTILISGSNRLAVINYRVYLEGDKIGGEKISEITLDHVVLSDGSEERVLRISQSQTKVTVEDTGGK